MRKSRDKWGRRHKWFFFYGVVFLFFVPFLFLCYIDRYHESLGDFLRFVIGKNNYFKGEIWFSIIVSYITAVPSIFCGILAIIQTKRNHELEDRYHRPNLELCTSCFEVRWLNESSLEGIPKDFATMQYIKRIEKEHLTANWMFLFIELEVTNSIGIKDIELNKIIFKFNRTKEQYRMKFPEASADITSFEQNGFAHIYKEGKHFYRINWSLYPYILENIPSDKEKKFWNAIEGFTNFENRMEEDYRYMDMYLEAKVFYEYASDRYEKVIGVLKWDGRRGKGRYGKRAERSTENGYFTYDDKKWRGRL